MNVRHFGMHRIVAAGIALSVAACLLAGGTLGARAADPIPLHVILPLTGSEAFLGQQEKNAIDIAVKFVNRGAGDAVTPIYHDDQSAPQVALQLLSQLTADHVQLILGPAGRGTCLAISPVLAKGPVDYCFSPTIHSEAGSYVFMASVDTGDLDRAMVRYARLKGWKRLALITSTDATGTDAVRIFSGLLKEDENAGMQFITQETFNASDISVTAQAARIKSVKPDAVFAWTTGLGLGTVFRALNEAGVNVPVATSWGNMTFSQLKNWGNIVPTQLLFPTTSWAGSATSRGIDPRVNLALKDLDTAFAAAGVKPDAGAAVAWDPILISTRVMRSLGPNATAEQIRAGLAQVQDFAGINGLYNFSHYPQRGIGEQNAVIARWTPKQSGWEIVSKTMGEPLDTKTRP
jgi:branched-chain amino acid transport system substrate-binding protein